MSSDEETDSLNVTVESNDGCLYILTPQGKVRMIIKNNCSIKCLLRGLEPIRQVHQATKSNMLLCHTHCKGPVRMKNVGLNGAVSILVMVVLVNEQCLKRWLSMSLVILQKLALLHR